MPRISILATALCVLSLFAPGSALGAAPDSIAEAQQLDGISWVAGVPRELALSGNEWGAAAPGAKELDPIPSCTGSVGFYNVWYAVPVNETSELSVHVTSSDPTRFQPLVQLVDAGRAELACGLANDVRLGGVASATALITPPATGPATVFVRIGEVANNAPSAGLPTLKLEFIGHDVTGPRISVKYPALAQPRKPATYDASATTDGGSGLNLATATWTFSDGKKPPVIVQGELARAFTWRTAGPWQASFSIADAAGNVRSYALPQVVVDTKAPRVRLQFYTPPVGARSMRVRLQTSEHATFTLLITQNGRVLFQGHVRREYRQRSFTRVRLRHRVSRGRILVTGYARDRSQNTTPLPSCTTNPVNGSAVCHRS